MASAVAKVSGVQGLCPWWGIRGLRLPEADNILLLTDLILMLKM
jgi:hypothetical protein